MPIFAGYINLKPINGIIFPSYAQNQINKEYITSKLNGEFFMSTNENTYGKNNIVLTFQGKLLVFLNKFFPNWVDTLVFKNLSKEKQSPF